MHRLQRFALVAGLLVTGCRPSDGQNTPAGAPAARPGEPASAASASDSARQNELLERADAGRIQGSPNASVWLVEISDFQCPYCKQWHDSTYPVIKREFIDPGHVRMAYVNLPLSSIHPHAVPASIAAMCSAVQDRFWPVHDAIFKSQNQWNGLSNAVPFFDSLVVAQGVDRSTYDSCVRSQVMHRLLNGDRHRASAAGVTSTPVFFVGDLMIRGAAPIDQFRAAITEARRKAGASAPR